MFYQTTLQSVGNNCAVDIFGRNIKFIGCLPVLGDDDNLRGYVIKGGKLHKYNVKQDDWIVNNQNTFKHGSKDFEGGSVIDSEIAKDVSLITVKNGFYQKDTELEVYPYVFQVVYRIPASQASNPNVVPNPFSVDIAINSMTDYGWV